MTNRLSASIIIPTYKRPMYLSRCLDAVAVLDTDPAMFEVIVVDNNSADTTQEVCREFAESHPGLVVPYLCETEPGSSSARNRGVKEARGEILCFLDDDSTPYSNWLGVLLGSFNDPHVGCAGGPSLLDFQGQDIPTWLRGDMQGLLSGFSLPYAEPTPVHLWTDLPYACNMAIRRKLFNELGLFRTDLGKSGYELRASGETELIKRIHHSGWKVLYVPDARVRHFVLPQRLDISYLYRRGRGLQETHILLTSDTGPIKIARWFASDLWYAVRMFFWFVVAVIRRKELWFDDYMRFWMVGLRLPLRAKWLMQNRVRGAR